MYINPIVVGVLMTLLIEIGLLIMYTVHMYNKAKRGERKHD